MQFADRLNSSIHQKMSRLVVGIDPHFELVPSSLLSNTDPTDRDGVASIVGEFCFEILDAIHDVAVAVKPQVAFFERFGPKGYVILEEVVLKAQEYGLLVISDCKRGDIGSTAAAYADYHLGSGGDAAGKIGGLGADAITLNPYLGEDSLAPFEGYLELGRGMFLLVKTSNKGSGDIQDRPLADEQEATPVYLAAAKLAQSISDRHKLGESGYSSVGIVVGATYPKQAEELRRKFPHQIFLVPGVGAQGATAKDVRCCFDQDGLGAVINASRSVIFAYRNLEGNGAQKKWKDAARQAAIALRDEINAAIAGG